MKIENIDFILSHFQNQLQQFPRKMLTLKNNWQFTVTSRDEIFRKCEQSNFMDCSINAYPEYTNYKGIIRQPPNFIFIDLDLPNFGMDRNKLDFRLNKTLKKVSEYDGFPTVLWSGNGYHIYLPIKAIVLDQEEIFSKGRFPCLFSTMGKYNSWSVSEVFLKFAEIFFTNNKADPLHKPKYKTCLIRIPGTYNSENIERGERKEESLVKIVQEWNGKTIPVQPSLRNFRAWITQEEYDQRIQNRKSRNAYSIRFNNSDNFQIPWIERLLQTGIPDGRKETLRLILGPYIGRRKSCEESFVILERWLDRCDCIRPLDRGFNSKQRIKSSLKNTKGFLSLNNLKLKYPSLHSIIIMSINA